MNAPQSSSNPAIAPNELVTFCIVAGSSILLLQRCLRETGLYSRRGCADRLDAAHGFALPFFVALVVFSPHESTPITIREWTKLVGLGFLGYYVSSLVNFTGLQYVSIGLERIILLYLSLAGTRHLGIFAAQARAACRMARLPCSMDWHRDRIHGRVAQSVPGRKDRPWRGVISPAH